MSEMNRMETGDEKGMQFVWPGLVYKEFVVMILAAVVMLVLALLWDAPLREIASPGMTENPAKAPWYFLGLQELLVYFDPWIAGVALPSSIVIGLICIPYIDRNPVGGGYRFSARKTAMVHFLFGFALWFALIYIGTALRGPNWQFYWPWESWDLEKHLEEKLWSFHPLLGAALLAGYFGGGLVAPALMKKDFFRRIGLARYALFMLLMLGMYFVPVKIILRLFFHVRYILETPWFNI